MTSRTCLVEDCDRSDRLVKGLCRKHYQRQSKTGSTDPTRTEALTGTPLERILARVTMSEQGCWTYCGTLNKEGYGEVSAGRTRRAHIVAYEQFVGPVPKGKVLDHLCHTSDRGCRGGPSCLHRRCINPAHLEPVDNAVNILRGYKPNRTHCAAGHEFTPENTRYSRGGRSRDCRTCRNAYNVAWRLARKSA